jgi:acyl-CoA thioester hydrolase
MEKDFTEAAPTYEYATRTRVRYAETDKMGIVYYANYLLYFELVRTELLRSCGFSYADLEERGFMLPVLEVKNTYRAPAFYDDVLYIHARYENIISPTIKLTYRIVKEDSTLVAEGHSIHGFIKADTRRPTRPPKFFFDAFTRAIEIQQAEKTLKPGEFLHSALLKEVESN